MCVNKGLPVKVQRSSDLISTQHNCCYFNYFQMDNENIFTIYLSMMYFDNFYLNLKCVFLIMLKKIKDVTIQ